MVINANIYAQGKSHEQDVKAVIERLFEFSNNQNYKSAAELIAYSGEDDNRNNNDTFNVSDRMEFNQVKRICKQIYALLELSEYQLGDYKATFDNGVTHYNLDIYFISGEQRIKKRFQFVKTENGKYLLDQII
ncbi:hypothetical protein ACFLTH_02465 [Bacteroidota bacterium]